MHTAKRIDLSDGERATSEAWSRGRSTPARLVLRAKIVLTAASGDWNEAIATRLVKAKTKKFGVGAVRVGAGGRGRTGWVTGGSKVDDPEGNDRGNVAEGDDRDAGRRNPPEHTDDGEGRWPEEGDRVRARRLKPHLSKALKVSSDPRFVQKVREVVGCTTRRTTCWYGVATRRAGSRGWTGRRNACR